MAEEILDEDLNPIDNNSDYDATSDFEENYSLKRITFKSLMGFVLSILNFEKGILFTIKELIIRPRIVIEEYLKKDRSKLVNPIRFLVFSTALSAFLSIILINQDSKFNSMQVSFNEGYGMAQNDALEKITDTIVFSPDSILIQVDSGKFKLNNKKDEKAKEFGLKIQELAKKNSDKFIYIIVVFFSFFTFLFFKKNGYNLTEHLVINSFMSSVSNVFSIIFTSLSILSGEIYFLYITTFLSFTYVIYYWVCVYKRNSIGGVFRSILVFLISYFTFMLIIGLFAFLYVILFLIDK